MSTIEEVPREGVDNRAAPQSESQEELGKDIGLALAYYHALPSAKARVAQLVLWFRNVFQYFLAAARRGVIPDEVADFVNALSLADLRLLARAQEVPNTFFFKIVNLAVTEGWPSGEDSENQRSCLVELTDNKGCSTALLRFLAEHWPVLLGKHVVEHANCTTALCDLLANKEGHSLETLEALLLSEKISMDGLDMLALHMSSIGIDFRLVGRGASYRRMLMFLRQERSAVEEYAAEANQRLCAGFGLAYRPDFPLQTLIANATQLHREQSDELKKLKAILEEIRPQLTSKDTDILALETKLAAAREDIVEKDARIAELSRLAGELRQ